MPKNEMNKEYLLSLGNQKKVLKTSSNNLRGYEKLLQISFYKSRLPLLLHIGTIIKLVNNVAVP